MSILVAYATAHGSTKEIARRIADRVALKIAPGQVEVRSMDSLPALSSMPTQYQAVILGSAVHAQRWLGTGRHFLDTNADFLSGVPTKADQKAAITPAAIPTWAFTVGMPPSDSDLAREEEHVGGKIKKQLPLLREHKLFRGVFDKDDLNWFFKFVADHFVPEGKAMFGDHKDWNAIESWADRVGEMIKEGLQTNQNPSA